MFDIIRDCNNCEEDCELCNYLIERLFIGL